MDSEPTAGARACASIRHGLHTARPPVTRTVTSQMTGSQRLGRFTKNALGCITLFVFNEINILTQQLNIVTDAQYTAWEALRACVVGSRA